MDQWWHTDPVVKLVEQLVAKIVANSVYEQVCRHVRRHGTQVTDAPSICGGREMYLLLPFVVLLDPEHQGDGSVVTIANGKTAEVLYISPHAKDGMAVMIGKGGAKLVSLASAPTGEVVLEALLDEWRAAIEEHQVFSDLLDLVLAHGQIVRKSRTLVTAGRQTEAYGLTVYELGPYLFIVEDCTGGKMDPRLALHMILMGDTGTLLFAGPAAIESVGEVAPKVKELQPQVGGFDNPPIDGAVVGEVLGVVSRIVHPPSSEVPGGSA